MCIPRPAAGGIAGGGRDLRKIALPAGPYGGKGENEAFSLVAPPCDPVPTSPSVPKAKLLLEHEDAGRTGRRSTLKGKGEQSGKNSDVTPHFYRRRAFPASLSVAGLTGIFPFFPFLSAMFPLCPPGGGKGPVMGALPPFEAPFQTPESPPVPRAEALCSLPACSNKSFAFGTGGRTHPSPYAGRHEVRTRYPPLCVPRPAAVETVRGAGTT